MENEHFVDSRMAHLEPDAAWAPDGAEGLARLYRQGAALRRRRVLLAVGATAALGSFAFPATRVFAERCVNACVAQTEAVHGWLGLSPIPDFTLPDQAGRVVKLSALRGKVVLVNFRATWCPPCKEEIPWFVEMQRDMRDLAVVGVAMDEGGWAAVRPVLGSFGVNYPVVLGTEETTAQFGRVDQLPATFFLDRTGRVAALRSGRVSKQTYESDVRRLLAERR